MEEIGLLDTQIPSDRFTINRLMFTSEGTAVLGTVSDGIFLGEIGLSFISIPVQVMRETQKIQKNIITPEVAPQTTTIYVHQNQLAYLSNGQLMITDEGLITTVAEQQPVDKESLFFTTSANIAEILKPNRGMDSLALSRLTTMDDLLLEDTGDLDERLASVKDQLPPSPSGEELVITGTGEASTSNKETAASKEKDIPPPLRKGPFKCEICLKEFPLYTQYRKHSQFHLEDKPHKCPSCPASFNIPTNLILHKATHQVDSLECPECFKRFSRVASLKAHIMLHEREESLFCTECGDEFGNQVQLDKHMRSHDEEWVKPAARVYQCPSCDKQYSRASVLRQHMKDHIKVEDALSANSYKRVGRPRRDYLLHTCTVCGKSFPKPSHLIRHNRLHTGETPFKCNLCPRSFKQNSTLQTHITTKHEGIRPFKCQFCNAAFSRKDSLKVHVGSLHSIRNAHETVFQCSDCSCVFRQLFRLNAHRTRRHTPSTTVKTKSRNNNQPSPKLKPQLSSLSKNTSDKENDAKRDKHCNKLPQQRIITRSNQLEGGTIIHTTMKQRQIGSVKCHQCRYCGKGFKKPSDLVRHTLHMEEEHFKVDFSASLIPKKEY